MTRLLILLIRGYQRFLSPLKIRAHCIYTPTRSQYATEVLKKYGVLKDTWLTYKRILRYHPFVEDNCDSVPQRLGGIRIK